jgi:hypothetical protein
MGSPAHEAITAERIDDTTVRAAGRQRSVPADRHVSFSPLLTARPCYVSLHDVLVPVRIVTDDLGGDVLIADRACTTPRPDAVQPQMSW